MSKRKRWSALGRSPFCWSVLLAVLLHWLVGTIPNPLFFKTAKPKHDKPREDRPIEVVPSESIEKQIVRNPKAPSFPEDNDAPAKYYAENRRRVDKETRAPEVGKFREAVGDDREKGDRRRSGDFTVPENAPDREAGLGSLAPQIGASPDKLEDVEKGTGTMLNTDALQFASFWNRIGDRIYDPWRRYAHDAMDQMQLRKKKIEPNVYVTRLRVILGADGRVAAISVLKSCGIDALDEASKKAFWDSEPFENPPRQMFDRDKVATLEYEFSMHLQTSSFRVLPGVI